MSNSKLFLEKMFKDASIVFGELQIDDETVPNNDLLMVLKELDNAITKSKDADLFEVVKANHQLLGPALQNMLKSKWYAMDGTSIVCHILGDTFASDMNSMGWGERFLNDYCIFDYIFNIAVFDSERYWDHGTIEMAQRVFLPCSKFTI